MPASAPCPGPARRRRWPATCSAGAFADQPADLLTGAEPTEAEVKRRLDGGRVRVVHLATHGFFESPDRVAALRAAARRESRLGPAADGRHGRDGRLAFALTPLLHSGVVLAGGGRDPDAAPADPSADAPAREDGILTAEEVQALDLRGTELVVLSACETGLGDARAAARGCWACSAPSRRPGPAPWWPACGRSTTRPRAS